MARGNIPITKRSDLARPINTAENDENLDNLRNGILASSEAPDADHAYGVVADTAATGTGLDPEDYEIRGAYFEIKDPAELDLPAAVTDSLVQVLTLKMRLNADDAGAFQMAGTQAAGLYVRGGTTGAWGAWQGVSQQATETALGLLELASAAEAQGLTDALRAITPATLAAVTATSTRTGLVELATQTEVNTGADPDRAVTPATLNGRAASTSLAGLIELADQTEVNAGSDAVRAVTPATLAGRTATATRAGVVELATQAEVTTGTDPDRAVTPATLAGKTSSTSAAGLVELATTAETETGTDTARAITPAGLKGAIGFSKDFVSSQQTFVAGETYDMAHGLGGTPVLVQMVGVCISGEQGYSVNDEVDVASGGDGGSGDRTITVCRDATNITAVVGANGWHINNKSTQQLIATDLTKWRFVARGWR